MSRKIFVAYTNANDLLIEEFNDKQVALVWREAQAKLDSHVQPQPTATSVVKLIAGNRTTHPNVGHSVTAQFHNPFSTVPIDCKQRLIVIGADQLISGGFPSRLCMMIAA